MILQPCDCFRCMREEEGNLMQDIRHLHEAATILPSLANLTTASRVISVILSFEAATSLELALKFISEVRMPA